MRHDSPILPQELRKQEFPIVNEQTYLNTATQGPLPQRTCRAIEQFTARAQFPGNSNASAGTEQARISLARLLVVGEDDLVFTSNTTHGLNICAHGIEWRPGENVVIPENDFPSLTRAWLNMRAFGVEVRQVAWHGEGPDVETLMAAVDSHTRAVSCSAVAWDTGYRIDLEALGRRCAQAGALLIIDGIQAVGAVDLDLRALGVSALTLHGYKWLVSGFGCGALYVAPDAIDQIRPRFVGEQSVTDGDEPSGEGSAWQPGALRYTVGGSNYMGLTALATSLALIEQIGLPAIAQHTYTVGQQLVEGLERYAPDLRLVSPRDPERRAAIVTFTLGDPARDAELVRRLGEQGIVVALRPRGVRVSPHFYNTPAEIERFLDALPQVGSDLGLS
jgi:cysteine desulfurase / selenocysteine lyase